MKLNTRNALEQAVPEGILQSQPKLGKFSLILHCVIINREQ